MSTTSLPTLGDIIRQNRDQIRRRWSRLEGGRDQYMITAEEFQEQVDSILDLLAQTDGYEMDAPSFEPLRQRLSELSYTRALQGYEPRETAKFILGLRRAIAPSLEKAVDDDRRLNKVVSLINNLLDELGLYSFQTYLESREEIIREQRNSIQELSTPVVQVWDEILTLPLIGSVDTERTQQIMENLLNAIVARQARVVIMDITGVPVVDTAVAKHLMQTVTAARLLGAEVILVGISARIAQTLVHLGVDLATVRTRMSLAQGLELAFRVTGHRVVRVRETEE